MHYLKKNYLVLSLMFVCSMKYNEIKNLWGFFINWCAYAELGIDFGEICLLLWDILLFGNVCSVHHKWINGIISCFKKQIPFIFFSMSEKKQFEPYGF